MVTKFAILPVPDFTLSALALFVDTLRLAGDEGDRSQRVSFDWQIIGETGLPVRSSCGVDILPTRPAEHPEAYDMIVVVGGLLKKNRHLSSPKEAFIRRAAALGMPIIALCTGSFVLAQYGLLDGYEASVSWFHIGEFRADFPEIRARADCLFTIDRNRATCAGGTGAADLAGHLVNTLIDKGAASKASRILLLDRMRDMRDVQPGSDMYPEAKNAIIRRALLLMESSLPDKIDADQFATRMNISRRQLERVFKNELGRGPIDTYLGMRLKYAQRLLQETEMQVAEIAYQAGFTNAQHFSRVFRTKIGVSPSSARARPANAQVSVATKH